MLKLEQKSAIIEVSEHPGFRALMSIIEALVESQEQQTLATPLTAGKESEILYAKARAEGASKLHRDLMREVEKLRTKKPN